MVTLEAAGDLDAWLHPQLWYREVEAMSSKPGFPAQSWAWEPGRETASALTGLVITSWELGAGKEMGARTPGFRQGPGVSGCSRFPGPRFPWCLSFPARVLPPPVPG